MLAHTRWAAVEFGLMSTTSSRETAMQYSGKGGKRCTVFEITAGRVDVGADIGFLSQYPGEKEFLMQPLSCLEVHARMYVPSNPKPQQ
jgi:NLR family CARD domain-containing protein 3